MMRKNLKLLGAAMIAVFAVGSAAFAERGGKLTDAERQQRRAAMLQKFDANRDGQLDESEKAALRKERFEKREQRRAERVARFDANRDGVLDQAEKSKMRDELVAERFKKLDRDGNGALSLEEFKAGKQFGKHGRRGAK